MVHEIEYIKLEENEIKETIIEISLIKFKDNPNKLKFGIIKAPLSHLEDYYLKEFIKDKILNGNFDKVFSQDEVEQLKLKLNKK